MSILSNFRNPWEADRGVLESDVLDTSVLQTEVLNNDVLKPPTVDKGRGTHFYDEKGKLIYKSKYGEGAAITILTPSLVEKFKNNFGLNSNPVILAKEDDILIKYYRQRYGNTYLIYDMLQIYEKSKIDKRTQYNPRYKDGSLKYPHYIDSKSNQLLTRQPPVEVACPLYLNGYGEVEVGDYQTELAIGNTPLVIDYSAIEPLKKSYQPGFLHTEPIVGLKNVSEKQGDGTIYDLTKYLICQGPSSTDVTYYTPAGEREKVMKIFGYHSVIIRPYSIVFFKAKMESDRVVREYHFCIEKKDLP